MRVLLKLLMQKSIILYGSKEYLIFFVLYFFKSCLQYGISAHNSSAQVGVIFQYCFLLCVLLVLVSCGDDFDTVYEERLAVKIALS